MFSLAEFECSLFAIPDRYKNPIVELVTLHLQKIAVFLCSTLALGGLLEEFRFSKKLQMSKLVVFILLANGKTSITEIYRSKKC